MSALYTLDILRLAASIPHYGTLDAPMVHAERRSVVCGSRVGVDLILDQGVVSEAGLQVNACALGQAAASLLGAHLIGRTPRELEAVRDALATWLSGDGAQPDWPGIAALAPALPHPGRHAAIRLPFEVAARAATEASAPAPA